MDYKYTSKVAQFLSKHHLLRDQAFQEIATVGLSSIRSETPVDTGELKDANGSTVVDNTVVFYNEKEYAPFVELGTMNMSANPFFRRGINSSKGDFISILVKNLKVGN